MKTTRTLSLLILAMASCTPPISCAQIYSGRTTDGTSVLSDFRSKEASSLLVASIGPDVLFAKAGPPGTPTGPRVSKELRAVLQEVGDEYHLDPRLLHAVILTESGYDPKAVSGKGARGLMQIMPATGRRFGAKDLFDPRENIRTGAKYLSWLLELFKGDVELALAGYNAGENAVIKSGYRIPPYPETRRYVPKVLSYYRDGAD